MVSVLRWKFTDAGVLYASVVNPSSVTSGANSEPSSLLFHWK
jgi:hypothetical protein